MIQYANSNGKCRRELPSRANDINNNNQANILTIKISELKMKQTKQLIERAIE